MHNIFKCPGNYGYFIHTDLGYLRKDGKWYKECLDQGFYKTAKEAEEMLLNYERKYTEHSFIKFDYNGISRTVFVLSCNDKTITGYDYTRNGIRSYLRKNIKQHDTLTSKQEKNCLFKHFNFNPKNDITPKYLIEDTLYVLNLTIKDQLLEFKNLVPLDSQTNFINLVNKVEN
jgi:hypothetical protein